MMAWLHTLTITASVAGIIGGYAFLFDRRLVDLHKRIDETNKRIDDLKQDIDKRLDRIEQDIREIRQLLYKVFEVPQREDK